MSIRIHPWQTHLTFLLMELISLCTTTTLGQPPRSGSLFGLLNLPALTLHESAPGPAFQIAIALEHKNQPEFRRFDYISAYGEGWALYCEKLGQEMGMYETPYERCGMLGNEIWRAARLVVDTGVHSKGWTREQALKYMHDYTALPEHEIETEVDRYIAWPGQALSYYMGELAIVRAREKAEKTLGAKFNIRAFHDAVSSSARYRCLLSRRGSTASSPRTAKVLTRIWSEQVSGVWKANRWKSTTSGSS